MIEIHALTKRYGPTTAVSDLTFTVRPGTVTAFLGPNGAGKSTTTRMILGLDQPTSGSVLVNTWRPSGCAAATHDRCRQPLGCPLVRSGTRAARLVAGTGRAGAGGPLRPAT